MKNPDVWCLECKHPWLWHDENGCNTGSAGLDGGCECKVPRGDKCRIPKKKRGIRTPRTTRKRGV
jgi:hypothetical protein